MAQPRGYNPDKHSALPYVDKQYKDKLNEISDITNMNKKKSVEKAIDEFYKRVSAMPA